MKTKLTCQCLLSVARHSFVCNCCTAAKTCFWCSGAQEQQQHLCRDKNRKKTLCSQALIHVVSPPGSYVVRQLTALTHTTCNDFPPGVIVGWVGRRRVETHDVKMPCEIKLKFCSSKPKPQMHSCSYHSGTCYLSSQASPPQHPWLSSNLWPLTCVVVWSIYQLVLLQTCSYQLWVHDIVTSSRIFKHWI